MSQSKTVDDICDYWANRIGKIDPLRTRIFLFLSIGGVLTWALARCPGLTMPFITGFLALLMLLRCRKIGMRLSFSLTSMLMLTGLIACVIVFQMLGDPWSEVSRRPGHEVNVAISPSGQLVAYSQGTSIEIREAKTGHMKRTIKMPTPEATQRANQKWVFKMAFTNDEKALMTVDWQTSPCLLDVATGEEIRKWPAQGLSNLSVSGTRFVVDTTNATSTSAQTNVYGIESTQPLLTIESGSAWCRSLSPSGTHVLIGKSLAIAELWNVDKKRLFGTIPLPQSSPANVLFFGKFSDDGKTLAVPTETGLSIWDLATFSKIAEWNPSGFDYVQSLEWSSDGSRLVVSYVEYTGPSGLPAATSPNGTLQPNAVEHCSLLDRNGNEVAVLEGTNAKFSPSGDSIYTVNGIVQVFDGRTGLRLTNIRAARPIQLAMGQSPLCFSNDGNWLLTNGSPTVFHKNRSEYWYSVYQLPAFWGITLFLTALLVLSIESLRTSYSQTM